MEHSDDIDSFIDRNILKSERFKNVKKNKIQITIKPRTKEEIPNLRNQEKLRYQKPLQPWEYTLSNGNIAIVAPLFTNSKPLISKAREHELLKNRKAALYNFTFLSEGCSHQIGRWGRDIIRYMWLAERFTIY